MPLLAAGCSLSENAPREIILVPPRLDQNYAATWPQAREQIGLVPVPVRSRSACESASSRDPTGSSITARSARKPGHIVYVISGSLVIEHADDTRTALSTEKRWHTPDDAKSPHRVLCEAGATLFIVD
jgi:hypothetical protein